MTSRAAPLLLAALAGALLAVASPGLAFGVGVRYGLAHARPQAFEAAVRGILLDAVKLGRVADSLQGDLGTLRRQARERPVQIKLIEVPVYRRDSGR